MPILRIPVGGREFAPSWLLTALVVALCAAFVGLGRWQWERGDLRQQQWEAFARGEERVLPLGSRNLEDVPRFTRVSVTGRYDPARQFLLENRTYQGRPGYEVLTPFELLDGRIVLVDRGWVPFEGYRDRLPDIDFEPRQPVTLTARVDELPPAGLASGRVAPAADGPWPRVASFPTAGQLGAALGRELAPRVLLLDADAPHGYVRDWRPPGVEPGRHWSYAIQWWGFAVVLVILWIVVSTRARTKEIS